MVGGGLVVELVVGVVLGKKGGWEVGKLAREWVIMANENKKRPGYWLRIVLIVLYCVCFRLQRHNHPQCTINNAKSRPEKVCTQTGD